MNTICRSVIRRQCVSQLLELDCSLFAWNLTTTSSSFDRKISSASKNNIENFKARKSYEKSLSDLRKEWFKEVEEKKRVAAENKAAKAREVEERREQRGMSVYQSEKEDLRLKREEERTKSMALKSAKRAENVQRESVRQDILESMRDERKQALLEQSRYWISTEEELAQAVDRAMEKVEPLYVSKKVSKRVANN